MAPAGADKESPSCGNEPWSPPQEVALVRAWWSVISSPFGTGAAKKPVGLWLHVLKEFLRLCKELGINAATGKRSKKQFRLRTARGLFGKFKDMNHDINMFLGDYIRASYVIKKSGANEKDCMDDAHIFYAKKHKEEFVYQLPFEYLSGKSKWLLYRAQTLRNEGKLAGPPVKKTAPGGPGCRKEKRMRVADTDEEDEGDRVPGQKLARRLAKEGVVNDAAAVKNFEAIAEEQAKCTERSKLHHKSLDLEIRRAAADMLAAQVAQQKEDNMVMRMDLSDMPPTKRAYFEAQIEEICQRQMDRRDKRVADARNARVAAEGVVREAQRARDYATSPEGLLAAYEAARVAAAAMASTDLQSVEDDPLPPPTPLMNLGAREEEEEVEDKEEGESELEAFAKLIEAFAAQRGPDTSPDDVYNYVEEPHTILRTPLRFRHPK